MSILPACHPNFKAVGHSKRPPELHAFFAFKTDVNADTAT